MKPFAGQRYEPLISQGADDGLAFWELLYVTLEKAGWKYVPVAAPSVGRPPAGIPIAAIPGVEIRIDPGKKDELVSAALALGNALHADGTVVAVNINNQSRPAEADRDILLGRVLRRRFSRVTGARMCGCAHHAGQPIVRLLE